MASLLPYSPASVLLWTICAPAASTLALLAVTYAFTYLRYRAQLWRSHRRVGGRQSPIKVPYAVPFLGHVFSLMSPRTGSFWQNLVRWHTYSTGACTLKVGGKNMHILYDARAIQAMFRALQPVRHGFDFNVVHRGLGLEYPETQRYFGLNEGPSPALGGATPRAEQERMLTETLLRTDRVNELTKKFMEVLQEQLSSELVNGDSIEVDLYAWLRKRVFRASTTALFGSTWLEDHPELEQDFFDFDQNHLTCFFGFPRWMAPKAYADRDRLTARALRARETNTARSKDTIVDPDGEVSWEPFHGSRANRARQLYYQRRNLHPKSRAVFDIGFLFGISSNAIPAAGWTLMHILAPDNDDATLLPRILNEIATSKNANGSLDVTTLISRPFLLATVHEAMRLYNDTMVTRELPTDLLVPVGSTAHSQLLLRRGSIVVAPTWIQHRDPRTWSDPDSFRPRRFLSPDPKSGDGVVFSTSGLAGKYFPFGGGKAICPGRVFAKQEIIASVAMMLDLFEFEVQRVVDGNGRELGRGERMGWRDALPGSTILTMDGEMRVKIRRKCA